MIARELFALGVTKTEVTAIAGARAVTVDAVLAEPARGQPRDVAHARAEVWARLEDLGHPVSRIARLWGCPVVTVAMALGRRAKKGAGA